MRVLHILNDVTDRGNGIVNTAVDLAVEQSRQGLEVAVASAGGGYKPLGIMPGPLPRTYLVAGTQEPFFLGNARRWAVALRDAGANVVMHERAGSHGGAFWREEFPLMVAWAFGR